MQEHSVKWAPSCILKWYSPDIDLPPPPAIFESYHFYVVVSEAGCMVTFIESAQTLVAFLLQGQSVLALYTWLHTLRASWGFFLGFVFPSKPTDKRPVLKVTMK